MSRSGWASVAAEPAAPKPHVGRRAIRQLVKWFRIEPEPHKYSSVDNLRKMLDAYETGDDTTAVLLNAAERHFLRRATAHLDGNPYMDEGAQHFSGARMAPDWIRDTAWLEW